MNPRAAWLTLLLAGAPAGALAQSAAPAPVLTPAPAPRSAEQAVMDAQLHARPATPPPGLNGAEAQAIYRNYLAGIGKARSPFAGNTSSTAGYGGAATVGQ